MLKNYSKKILILFVIAFGVIFYVVSKGKVLTTTPRALDVSGYAAVTILGNDIYTLSPSGNADKVLFELSNFSNDYVVKFSDITVSPNNASFCFLGHLVDGKTNIYAASIGGVGLSKVGVGKNCVWSPDSTHIAYNNYEGSRDLSDVFVYRVKDGSTKNYTVGTAPENTARSFSTPAWKDSSTLKLEYKEFSLSSGQPRNSGELFLEIDN